MKEFSKRLWDILEKDYAGLNLVSFKTEEEFYIKQILDSLLPYKHSKIFKDEIDNKKNVLDVGFGGGHPILALAQSLPSVKFHGIDARKKKVLAVRDIADKLGLMNVTVEHCRLENMAIEKRCVIVFKAVGKCSDLLSKIKTNSEVTAFFYKGPQFENEEGDVLSSPPRNWKLLSFEKFGLEGTLGRTLVGFRKVPCGTVEGRKWHG